MWARYIAFYLCQRMRRLRWQRFLTLSQRKKKVVSYPPEVHLNVSKQLFLNFHFFHWFKLDLVKMAKLACDLLCQRMRRMRQHFASVCGACGSNLLAQTAHTLANCQRMRRIRQHFASVDGACGSKNKRVYMIHILYSGIDSYTLIHIFKPIHTYYTYRYASISIYLNVYADTVIFSSQDTFCSYILCRVQQD